ASASRATATSRSATSSSRSRSRAWPRPWTPRPRHRRRASPNASSHVTVGIARLTLYLPASHSLKDKRMVLRRVKDRVRQKFNVSVAEVEDNDLWQRSVVGLALCGNDAKFVA